MKRPAEALIALQRVWPQRNLLSKGHVMVEPTVTEEWRAVVGYEGLYEVSNVGRVRSLGRVAVCKGGWTITKHPKAMKIAIHHSGYAMVTLTDALKNRKITLVHIIVAAAFIGTKDAGMQVNHKDGNKSNNYFGNLEYVTPSRNRFHAIQSLGVGVGERSGRTTLKEVEVHRMRRLRSEGVTMDALAELFHVCSATVSNIVTRKTWKHI